MPTSTRRGLTLTDVVIVIAMLALIAPIVFRAGRETTERVRCGSNLRQIGQAMLVYANSNKGSYPRTTYQRETPPTQYTGVQAPNPFGPGGPAPNDVTAAMFLLLRTQNIEPTVFICSKVELVAWNYGGGGRTAQHVSNFPGELHLSYSFTNPYPGKTAVDNGYVVNTTNGAEFAIAADMNPGKGGGYDAAGPKSDTAPQAQMKQANSRNHDGAGQSVLYGDGHVDFVQNPFCGTQRDNIYTVAGGTPALPLTTSGTIVGSPIWAGDSVLLPVATTTPPIIGAAARRTVNRTLIGFGIVLLLVIGLIVLVLVTHKRKPALEASPPPLPPR